MSVPAVKGYMPLCVTPRSQVCDEQGVGQWPMWQRFDSVKGIIDQYVDEPYRDFLARPELDVDRQKGEEFFFWYTPHSNDVFVQLSRSGDDYDYYKELLNKTLAHYHSVVEKLKNEGKAEEANFLQLSLKYAGTSEDSVYCGNNRVVTTVWGMRPRQGYNIGDSVVMSDLFPPTEVHTVQYELGEHGSTEDSTVLKKSHGTKIQAHQIPQVTANEGYVFTGWNPNPLHAEVIGDLFFTAQYNQIPTAVAPKPAAEVPPQKHHVRFLVPGGQVIKEMNIEHGNKILPGYIPQLPVVNGILCSAWDGDPLNDIINADRDYKAIAPNTQAEPLIEEPKTEKIVDGQSSQKKHRGFLDALLKWMLLSLGLLLLFLLLWCFVFDKCHFNFCEDDCNCEHIEPEPRPVPHTGDVQILLSWSNYNDLDISCVDPMGKIVDYTNKRVPSGGELDVDMNAGGPTRSDPIENIYWPTGGAPKGKYTVFLTYYMRYDGSQLATPYVVKIKYGNETETYTGTLEHEKQRVKICSFTLE